MYPGTSLRRSIEEAVDACITAPREPAVYYNAIMKQNLQIRLKYGEAVSSPCIDNYLLRVEAVIAERKRLPDNRLEVFFDPLLAEAGKPVPYSRLYGCLVEMLIAFTRIKVFQRTKACKRLIDLYRVIVQGYKCVLHSSTEEEYHSMAFNLLKQAATALMLAGCCSPSSSWCDNG